MVNYYDDYNDYNEDIEEVEEVEEEPEPIDIESITALIQSLNGIYSVHFEMEEPHWIRAIHLMTDLSANIAVRMIRTAVYVKIGYLIDDRTLFRIAKMEK